ncbi:ABC transporter G family member 25 [Hondaea fermentalgiana]|uniref:ABC transporter G family member 25 n=1 Tax=Hondaea fermentalgiana TaxID=2315210 RepID=A0A2R5GXE4_9STRA|nr:ABC transporter G family member 25 [Hondaea fermentalgiana]|eukprot:GBG33363.1 ABC transporter G family member 25 [Hondaea fermentalgiana]
MSQSSLWTIGLLERVTESILRFVESMARSWVDERGHNPLDRFMRADDPGKAFCPSMRVVLIVLLGFFLTTGAVYLTEDQYIKGPLLSDERGVTNATDFPVHIAFRNVGCAISDRADPVLDRVTGEIRPGTLTAILGRSGSGKTTLANLILGRSRKFCDRQYGRVYMNGRPRSLEVILDRVGFVPQDDVLYPELTVEETFRFSAESRLPRTASAAYKDQVLEELLDMLGLRHLRHTRIGSKSIGGLSGGEAKRVSIGIELITQPSILIMDEPTSGLDSAAAYTLIQMLRRVADRGVAVVAVLHQPTTRIYNLLNDTILLRAGRPVYVGRREKVLDYFESLGFRIPDFDSPANITTEPDDSHALSAGLPTSSGSHDPANSSKIDGLVDHRNHVSEEVDDENGDDVPESYYAAGVSPPEFLLDILAGFLKPERAPAKRDDGGSVSLESLWIENGDVDGHWQDIEIGMDRLRREEQSRVERLYASNGSTGVTTSGAFRSIVFADSGLEACDENYPSVFRYWCYILWGLSGEPGDPSYPVRPKQGLFYQVQLWFVSFARITWRRGIFVEAGVISLLASAVGFTRSYNVTWNRRALGGFFISIALTLSGMLAALFNDDIGPVRRAADSGMTLGAYELAMIIFIFFKAIVVAHLFAIVYFSMLYLRRGVWCTSPFSLSYYFEFAHLLHELYMCAHSIGSLICAISDHNLLQAYLMSLAVFICVHTFAFFAPSQNQILEDALMFGRFNSAPLVNFICSLSYVRYFMEAYLLWEPTDDDVVSRNTALRYHGYHERHKSMCYTSLFAIWTFNQAMRFLMFARHNRNVFNSLHDTPLFIIFVSKLIVSFIFAISIMTVVHELPRLRAIFSKARAASSSF